MVVAGLLTTILSTARESFELLLSIGAGTGLLYLLRWFWWRVNSWSEIAAMASSFLIAVVFFAARKSGAEIPSHVALLTGVFATTLIWVVVTFVTRPVDDGRLVAFYRLVRPAGPGWSRIRSLAGVGASPDSFAHSLLGWVLGCLAVYSALFATGSMLYGAYQQALVWGALLVVSAVGTIRLVARIWRGEQ
jgi:hypothetical protein